MTPMQVLVAATSGNARIFKLDNVGSIAAGKNADLVIVRGNPAANINDVEKVEIVFKDGVGYDTAKLLHSVQGRYGQY